MVGAIWQEKLLIGAFLWTYRFFRLFKSKLGFCTLARCLLGYQPMISFLVRQISNLYQGGIAICYRQLRLPS